MRIVCANDQVFPLHETDSEQIVSMVAALSELGHHVDMWLPAPKTGPTPNVDAIARYYEVPANFQVTTFQSVFPARRTREKLAHARACADQGDWSQADVLYTRNIPTMVAALRKGDIPVLYETYRPWPRQVRLLRPVFRWVAKHPRFLGGVFHSHLAAEPYRELGMSEAAIHVAHNGHDPQRMQPVLSQAQARAQLGLPAEGLIVTYTGHVNMAKGLGHMFSLAAKFPHVRFVVVGHQGDKAVQAAVASLNNVQLVAWQPFKDTVPYLYASDILFVPPTAGPLKKIGNTVLPIKTFLYLAAGRAIFAPNTPDLVEVLRDGENAALVTPDDPAAAEARLRTLLEDADLRQRLGATAQAAAANFTWKQRAARLVAFVEERLGRQRA